MSSVTKKHTYAMHRVMAYCAVTPKQVWIMKPRINWGGKYTFFEFETKGRSNYDCASFKATKRSVIGCGVYLEVSPIAENNSMHNTVALYLI